MTAPAGHDVQQVSADADLTTAQVETATRRHVFAPLKAGGLAGVPARDLQGLKNAGAKPGLGEDRHRVPWISTAIAFWRAHKGSSAREFAHAEQRREPAETEKSPGGQWRKVVPKDPAASRGNGTRKGDRSQIRHVRSFSRRTRDFPCKMRLHRGPEALGAFLTLRRAAPCKREPSIDREGRRDDVHNHRASAHQPGAAHNNVYATAGVHNRRRGKTRVDQPRG
jgi:hypothetical protein